MSDLSDSSNKRLQHSVADLIQQLCFNHSSSSPGFIAANSDYDPVTDSSILQNTLVHYGLPAISASTILLIAVFLLGDRPTMQLLAFGFAAFDIIVVPQFLKRAFEPE